MRYIDIHSHRPAVRSTEELRLESVRLNGLLAEEVHALHTISLHPWYEEDLTPSNIDALANTLERLRPPAIGEVGLDKLSTVPMSRQIAALERIITIANTHTLPLIIHCTRAWSELLALRNRSGRTPWVIHGYRKGKSLASQLLDAGCALSFGRYYDMESLRLAYERGALLLETDDDPVVDIQELYSEVAAALGVALGELLAQVEQTAQRWLPGLR